jgi:hypothetical protein
MNWTWNKRSKKKISLKKLRWSRAKLREGPRPKKIQEVKERMKEKNQKRQQRKKQNRNLKNKFEKNDLNIIKNETIV